MRILFKTSYLDDIRLFQHSGQTFWYGLLVLCLLLVPFVLGGLIVGISETLAGRYLPPGFKEIVAYLIMLGVLLVRPQGLFSTMQRKKV